MKAYVDIFLVMILAQLYFFEQSYASNCTTILNCTACYANKCEWCGITPVGGSEHMATFCTAKNGCTSTIKDSFLKSLVNHAVVPANDRMCKSTDGPMVYSNITSCKSCVMNRDVGWCHPNVAKAGFFVNAILSLFKRESSGICFSKDLRNRCEMEVTKGVKPFEFSLQCSNGSAVKPSIFFIAALFTIGSLSSTSLFS